VTDLGADYTPAEARINRIFDRLNSRIGAIIMSSAEAAASAAADQLVKAKTEIDAVLAELQDQAVSDATVARLQALSQSFDDVVPDAPVEPPAEPEPTPEP
jgi:ElaB/YqjD/DUF883 family membrane-anchored ribosome-binding protein